MYGRNKFLNSDIPNWNSRMVGCSQGSLKAVETLPFSLSQWYHGLIAVGCEFWKFIFHIRSTHRQRPGMAAGCDFIWRNLFFLISHPHALYTRERHLKGVLISLQSFPMVLDRIAMSCDFLKIYFHITSAGIGRDSRRLWFTSAATYQGKTWVLQPIFQLVLYYGTTHPWMNIHG